MGRFVGAGWAVAIALAACDAGFGASDARAAPVRLPPTVVRAPAVPGSATRPSRRMRDPIPPLRDPIADLPVPWVRGPEFRRGVSLGLFVSAEDPEARRRYYRTFLDEIAALGATDLQLVVRWSQADVAAHDIRRQPGLTADDALLRWVMREARRRGLRVFLMPILHLTRRARGDWRGTLAPRHPDAWWRNYRLFILHYADLAQDEQGDLLSVGSELASMESDVDRWRALIAEVRERFSGQLTYSANWDHFQPVAFWDALDVAGITGYATLSDRPFPDEDALVRGFSGLRQRLGRWYGVHGKPFLFSEIGYPAQVYAAKNPWDYRPRGAPQLQLQLRCYRALYRAWQGVRPLSGLYVWNWFGPGGDADGGYSPRGKPSAAVLRHWYLGSRVKTGAVVTPAQHGRREAWKSDG